MLPSSVFAASGVPGKVTLTKISAPAYNSVKITWKKTSNVTNYLIYYKTSGEKWKRIASVPASQSSYTHKSSRTYPIIVGKEYSYTVRGYNSKTKKYGSYNSKGLTIKTKPNTVKLESVSYNSEKDTATVKWKEAGGADQYLVYRKTPGSDWKKLAALNSNARQYSDKSPVKGTKNTYTVRSYNSKTKIKGNYNAEGVSVNIKIAATPTVTPEPTTTPAPEDITGLTINPEAVSNVVRGEYVQLTAVTTPANISSNRIEWLSLHPDVAKVDQNGKVTTLSTGHVHIMAYSIDDAGIWDEIEFEVANKKTEADESQFEQQALELINKKRAGRQLPSYQFNKGVVNAAHIRVKELETLYSETRPDGSNWYTALYDQELGTDCYTPYEFRAQGMETPEEFVEELYNKDLWILYGDKVHSDAGIGYHVGSNGVKYWILMLIGYDF